MALAQLEVVGNMKNWKYKRDNKMRAFGDTNYDKKIIRVNTKISKKVAETKHKIYTMPRKDSTVINTLVHETIHKDHPRMHEDTVRKLARLKVSKMSDKAKKKLYNKLA